MRAGAGISTPVIRCSAPVRPPAPPRDALDGEPADLVVVFASGAHLAAPEATLEGVHAALAPEALIGCGAGGVLGDGASSSRAPPWRSGRRRLTTAGYGRFTPRVAEVTRRPCSRACPNRAPTTALIMLRDPYSFPTDAVLDGLAAQLPPFPCSAAWPAAQTGRDGALFLGDEVCEDGAVGRRPGGRGDAPVRISGRGTARAAR